jgi:hypothetical protein
LGVRMADQSRGKTQRITSVITNEAATATAYSVALIWRRLPMTVIGFAVEAVGPAMAIAVITLLNQITRFASNLAKYASLYLGKNEAREQQGAIQPAIFLCRSR